MKRILVVEDETNLQILYKKELEDEGYEVIIAQNGMEALKKTKKQKPDLVVMDIRMPEKDGIEAMGEVLAFDKKIPVILNTAYEIYKDNFLTWPAEAYVVKSSDLTELKDTIANVLNKK